MLLDAEMQMGSLLLLSIIQFTAHQAIHFCFIFATKAKEQESPLFRVYAAVYTFYQRFEVGLLQKKNFN